MARVQYKPKYWSEKEAKFEFGGNLNVIILGNKSEEEYEHAVICIMFDPTYLNLEFFHEAEQ